mmetsp:Transcript_66026/g.204367  ORF Transcript_66026/g.204367 Transcript_66026/m.204367 type:complete len:476 (+) Transcript_66026:344-1771(+)
MPSTSASYGLCALGPHALGRAPAGPAREPNLPQKVCSNGSAGSGKLHGRELALLTYPSASVSATSATSARRRGLLEGFAGLHSASARAHCNHPPTRVPAPADGGKHFAPAVAGVTSGSTRLVCASAVWRTAEGTFWRASEQPPSRSFGRTSAVSGVSLSAEVRWLSIWYSCSVGASVGASLSSASHSPTSGFSAGRPGASNLSCVWANFVCNSSKALWRSWTFPLDRSAPPSTAAACSAESVGASTSPGAKANVARKSSCAMAKFARKSSSASHAPMSACSAGLPSASVSSCALGSFVRSSSRALWRSWKLPLDCLAPPSTAAARSAGPSGASTSPCAKANLSCKSSRNTKFARRSSSASHAPMAACSAEFPGALASACARGSFACRSSLCWSERSVSACAAEAPWWAASCSSRSTSSSAWTSECKSPRPSGLVGTSVLPERIDASTALPALDGTGEVSPNEGRVTIAEPGLTLD